MPTATRRTRRTSAAAQPSIGKENLAGPDGPSQSETTVTAMTSSKKARHRVSTTELARLEEVFGQETHPSRQQKKELATELGMDYKTITIWFQNKRQTTKRGQPPAKYLGQTTRMDSCLRSVSSPSHNATLEVFELEADPTMSAPEGKATTVEPNGIAPKAIIKIKPLIKSLNTLMSRSRENSDGREVEEETPNVKADPLWSRSMPESAIASAELNEHDHMPGQEEAREISIRWKRLRTLEWACERQAKRRKLSKEGFIRLGSEEAENDDSDDLHMNSALSLLSLASSTQVELPIDVMKGASLLLSFKHSWRRK